MKNNYLVKTPCIGICSTTYGDDICRGCKRFSHEVTAWIKYSDVEKDNVNSRLQKFKVLILSDKFSIVDDQKLFNFMKDNKIMFNDELNPLCWVFDLLRASSDDKLNLSEYGIEVKSSFKDLTNVELKDLINREFFELSVAHFDRYLRS